MTIVIISFTTRPGHGSEGGVGWSFLQAAAEVATRQEEKVIAIIDDRDARPIHESMQASKISSVVEIRPVKVPRPLLRMYGNRRTRASYIGWAICARKLLKEIIADRQPRIVHQVTFATASLPPVFFGIKDVRALWGPINITSEPAKIPGLPTGITRRIIQFTGKCFAFGASDVIATNKNTQAILARTNKRVYLEPNIFVDPPSTLSTNALDYQLCMVGNLNERKRPFLAIRMMQNPEFSDYHLGVVGDGPLRKELEDYAQKHNLSHRVHFLGRVSRGDAMKHIAQSRVLIHPSASEGAAWVVGEAAALGVPAVAFEGTGADSTITLCGNGGVIAESGTKDDVQALAAAVSKCIKRPKPEPSKRWSSDRLPALLEEWWK
ncbi:glycosyltransferase [Kocuria flava]|uniref:glycosyltransferase n=1 Tax=Kocuria flava TaxID=446860 RepID=UPI000B2AD0FB|nr:glycosyltransferase [Kocuria flava]